MESIRKNKGFYFGMAIIAAIVFTATHAHAFHEGWESSTAGIYRPNALPLPLIAGDAGYWILGDTVSEFPECGPTPHTAEILLLDGSQRLRLTSNDSASSCADNIWANLMEVPPLNLNPGFSIPVNSETAISFEATGNLTDPQKGSPYCVNPPCGDTVSLSLADNRGNVLAYVLQRAPDAVPNDVHSSYREVFLNPGDGVYSRNLFDDFSTIPNFNPFGAAIKGINFEVDAHGSATIDNICVGGSECVVAPPSTTIPDVGGLSQSQAEADIVAAGLIVGTVTREVSTTVPGGSVISQSPAAGEDVALGTEVDLVIAQKMFNPLEFKILPFDGATYDYFGTSVSISGDYAIVGAPTDDDQGADSGSAYIFERSGAIWRQVTKLTASDGAASDRFGSSVSISGDHAVVGAHGDNDNGYGSGSAYIFERTGTGWHQASKLTANGGFAFGWSVSLSNDCAIVGSPQGSGAAYIFERSGATWRQVAKLTASDGSASDSFGWSVSISDDYVIVGAIAADAKGDRSGAAYVFERRDANWHQAAKLTASDGSALDWFGYSVSISAGHAVVGAYGNDDHGDESGSAYVFGRKATGWSQVTKLTASDGAASDYFGMSVSISGDYAIVGAYRDDDKGFGSGSVYVFERSGARWDEVFKLTARDGAPTDGFGWPVSLCGDYAIVGAYNNDDSGESSGSAYIFNLFASGKMAMPWIPLLLMHDASGP